MLRSFSASRYFCISSLDNFSVLAVHYPTWPPPNNSPSPIALSSSESPAVPAPAKPRSPKSSPPSSTPRSSPSTSTTATSRSSPSTPATNKTSTTPTLSNRTLIEHVRALAAGRTIQRPVYDFSRHTRVPDAFEPIHPTRVVLVEGILALHYPELVFRSTTSASTSTPPTKSASTAASTATCASADAPSSPSAPSSDATAKPMADLYVLPSQAHATHHSRRAAPTRSTGPSNKSSANSTTARCSAKRGKSTRAERNSSHRILRELSTVPSLKNP